MNTDRLKSLLEDVKSSKVSVEEAFNALKTLPYQDLGFAKIDTHRQLRRGFPEVIFCQGKTPEQVALIVREMQKEFKTILGMRASQEVNEAVQQISDKADYNALSKTLIIGPIPEPVHKKLILVVSAGTADLPVAEEAAITARAMGNPVDTLYDAGVAGIHRLFNNREKIEKANVIIVAAGMEGALPGVVGGLVDKPVVAVPTSVGYGANFHGLSALLTMLNTCAPGVGVVNIDNGFGAGYLASLINRLSD